MRISLVSIGTGRGRRGAAETLADEYLGRAARYGRVEGRWVETEEAFRGLVEAARGREAARLVLLDAGGRLLTSEEFAGEIGGMRDRGAQHLVVGVGGADGWSAEARGRADLLVSMGRMTLPHGLARVVAAEQIYRAVTILAGHPYHCGH